MIREVNVEQSLLENANEMRSDTVKVSKAHLRVRLRQFVAELAKAAARAAAARSKARRAIKRSWTAEDAVKRLERRIENKKAEIAG